MKNLFKNNANYNLKKITNTSNKVIIAFTDEGIIATFNNLEYADLYCGNQNYHLGYQEFFYDEISVLEFNKSFK